MVSVTDVSYLPLDGLSPPEQLLSMLRRADDFIRLGVCGAAELCKHLDGEQKVGLGLMVGSCFGTMETNFDVLGQICSEEATSPILFSHSVFNAATGYIGACLGICGAGQTFTSFATPFFEALRDGWLAVESGRLTRCLVLQIETYSRLLEDGRKNVIPAAGKKWPAGVVCWLLQAENSDGHGLGLKLPRLELSGNPAAYAQLSSCGSLRIVGKKETMSELCHPMEGPILLTEWYRKGLMAGGCEVCIEGCWGEVALHFYDEAD